MQQQTFYFQTFEVFYHSRKILFHSQKKMIIKFMGDKRSVRQTLQALFMACLVRRFCELWGEFVRKNRYRDELAGRKTRKSL